MGQLKDPRQFIGCDFYRVYEKDGEKKIQIIGRYNLTVKNHTGFEMYEATSYKPNEMNLSEFIRQRNEAQKDQVIDRANKTFSSGEEIKAERLYRISEDLPEGNYIDRDNLEIRTVKAIFHQKQESQRMLLLRERTMEYMNGDNKTEKQDGLYKTRK